MKSQHVEGGGAPWYAPAESFEPCPWSCPTSGSCGPWMLRRPAPRKASVKHRAGAVCEGSLRHAVSLALSVSEWYRKDGQHTVRVGLLDRPVVGKGGAIGSVSSNPSAQKQNGAVVRSITLKAAHVVLFLHQLGIPGVHHARGAGREEGSRLLAPGHANLCSVQCERGVQGMGRRAQLPATD